MSNSQCTKPEMKSLRRMPTSAASGIHQPERGGDCTMRAMSQLLDAMATMIPQISYVRC